MYMHGNTGGADAAMWGCMCENIGVGGGTGHTCGNIELTWKFVHKRSQWMANLLLPYAQFLALPSIYT